MAAIYGKLFIISAPSGAGKSALVSSVLPRIQSHAPCKRVVTYTCRLPRNGERDGYDYHFLTPNEFEARIAQGFFLEWSGSYGTYYGSPASIKEDLSQGISCLMILDRQGARSILKLIPDAVLIWVTVPHIEVLRQRLRGRATEGAEQIERRLAWAQQEMEAETREQLYHFHLKNDSFNHALQEFESFLKEKI